MSPGEISEGRGERGPFSTKKMQKARQISILAAIVNAVALYTIGIIFFIAPEKIGPYQRGFYCDDESLRLDTKPNTVFAKDLFLATVALSFIIIYLCESYLYLGCTPENMLHYRWYNFNIPSFIVNTAKFYGFYHFGFVLQIIFTQIPKYFVGRLRPHFMEVCQPTPGFVCATPGEYITNFTCIEPSASALQINHTQSQHEHYLLEARMSFFSGHAASSLYFAVFISLYLQSRLATRGLHPKWLQKVQVSLFIIGLVVSYTRILDNFHHPTDVLFGIFYGAVMGYVTVKYIMGLFVYRDGHIAVENPEGISVFAHFVRPLEHNKSD